jgi:hypothetical protein
MAATEVLGRTVFILGRDMLIRNRTASGRSKDVADVALLEANRSEGR